MSTLPRISVAKSLPNLGAIRMPTWKQLKITLLAISLAFLFGCASNGTGTIGNGQIDIDLGDQKLFGSAAAYDIGVSLAQVALFEKPALAQSALTKLHNVKHRVADVEATYSVEQGLDIVSAMLASECGVWCQTIAGQKYMALVGAQLTALKAVDTDDVTVTLDQVVSELILAVQSVQVIQ
ncbi:hypothetical protein [uncultured Paraglaciecola sp.]|uniref:hypothetical protein n=1 Tax=uncultured Paraglaciecola sp. TaxID=1765024 RepID=UPI00262C5AF5|nr:hypothetical protein [uncultured Paraglaciecola sp.]